MEYKKTWHYEATISYDGEGNFENEKKKTEKTKTKKHLDSHTLLEGEERKQTATLENCWPFLIKLNIHLHMTQ